MEPHLIPDEQSPFDDAPMPIEPPAEPHDAPASAPASAPAVDTAPADAARRSGFQSTDAEAEAAVLALTLTSPEAFYDAVEALNAEDFGVRAHAEIWHAATVADAAGKPVDKVTIADELRRAKTLKVVGGTETLDRIAEQAPALVGTVDSYAEIVTERSLLRRLVNAGRSISADAMQADATGPAALESAEQKVFSLGETRSESTLMPMAKAVANTMSELASTRNQLLLGHPTGFGDLDRLTGGLQGSQLWIVAARPAMGKTAFALQIARHIAETTGLVVPFLSYEMSHTELTHRMLSTALRYDGMKLRQGDLPGGMERDLAIAAEALAQVPLWVDDNPPSTIGGVRSAMRRLARRSEIGAVFVDYLQLMEGDTRSRDANRTQEVSEISRGLKRLSAELNVPVIALSQLNRNVEMRQNKRPGLSDLRESGSIEQDANGILMLYRAYTYNVEEDPSAAEVIIAKQRSGPSGVTFNMRFDGECARFSDVNNASYGAAASAGTGVGFSGGDASPF
ncbi:MAG: replicative DNA helicase [Actinomycetia bacterium]|nr:replicative DNA helicase [Actinomycetes bacterium]